MTKLLYHWSKSRSNNHLSFFCANRLYDFLMPYMQHNMNYVVGWHIFFDKKYD